jgi:hypothetical protein
MSDEQRQVTNSLLVNGKAVVSQKGDEFAKVLVDDVKENVERLLKDKNRDVHLVRVCDLEDGVSAVFLYSVK